MRAKRELAPRLTARPDADGMGGFVCRRTDFIGRESDRSAELLLPLPAIWAIGSKLLPLHEICLARTGDKSVARPCNR
jgi:hypothetical protein